VSVIEPDAEDRELLDDNVRRAEAAYRDSPDFETQARALSGWREAIRHRLDAVPSAGTIDVPIVVVTSDGDPVGRSSDREPAIWPMTLDRYFEGVPKRFHDAERYVVSRTIPLVWHGERPKPHELRVMGLDGWWCGPIEPQVSAARLELYLTAETR
jgi:hypothetical protein